MNRFNYLGRSRSRYALRIGVIAIDNRIRAPLIALTATVLLTAATGTLQLARLHAAQNGYTRASMRVSEDGPALHDLALLRARVTRATGLNDYVAGAQRANLTRANELAWIGNHLPPNTYLRILRYENGSYALEGTTDRTAAIGAAMRSLNDERHALSAQLVSVRDEDGPAATRVRYALRVDTRP